MTYCDYNHFYSLLSPAEKKQAPKELFMIGDCNLMYSGVRVSVVGSRNISDDGKKRTEIITKALVENGITVVSGLAAGADTIAHTTTIKSGGKTIAVLGTPLDVCTPASNKELLQDIMENHLAVSQFKEGTRVFPSNFPTRNRTMALISDATIIIEAAENSGTVHQAWEAIRLNRRVYVLENVTKSATWANEIQKYGAEVMTSSNYKDLISSLLEFA